jgi:phytoene dehydrogenase-like protein
MEAIVVGGGLAGLVAASRLAEAGASVRLLERGTVGGRVRTAREDGRAFDRGFQVLFDAYPAARRELDLAALDLRRFRPGAVLCRPNSRATLSDPLRDPGAAVESALTREVTTGDKFRLFRLQRELRGTPREEIFAGPDESIAEYLDRRGFSERFVRRFAAPFYGGITLDRSLSTSKRAFEYSFRMLSEGYATVPARGMAAIPEQLAERARTAGADIETGTAVHAVEPDGEGVRAETGDGPARADAAVVATDPRTAGELTGVDTPTEWRGCVTQYYRLDGRLDTGRRLLLNADGEAPNEVVPVSAVAPEQAHEGETLVSATFLGDREEDDAELAALTESALAAWHPERSLSVEAVHTARVEFAQFAQPPGVHEGLPDPDGPDGPVYLAGDYTLDSSIDGALESGRRAAELLQERA